MNINNGGGKKSKSKKQKKHSIPLPSSPSSLPSLPSPSPSPPSPLLTVPAVAKSWFSTLVNKYFSYVTSKTEPQFNAIIILHGDYTPSRISSGVSPNLRYTTIPETTIYPNTNRKVVNIAPLGSSWIGHETRSGYMLNMSLIAKINPIVAAQYTYPIDYMRTDQHVVMGAEIKRGERKICNRLDELYQVYKSSPHIPSQIKHYQNELPKVDDNDSANDGYALFDKDDGLTGYIGYVYRHEMGYFLLNSIEIIFDGDMFDILTTILYYLNRVLKKDGISDAFAELSTPVLLTDENTGKRTYLVKYPRKFNMGQCKYFIAYMLLKTDPRLANLCKMGECAIYIRTILKRHVGYNPEDSTCFISEYNTELSTGYYPFLIRTFDYTVPSADMLLQYYSKIDPEKDEDISNIVFFPQDDPNMKRLRDIPSPLEDSASCPDYIKMNPKIGNGFSLDNLLHTKSFDRNNYKLTLFEFSEEDIMKFIGNVNNVTEYVFTCSGSNIHKNASSAEIKKYFELSKQFARGKRKTKKSEREKLMIYR
jgi:hypothetical protein